MLFLGSIPGGKATFHILHVKALGCQRLVHRLAHRAAAHAVDGHGFVLGQLRGPLVNVLGIMPLGPGNGALVCLIVRLAADIADRQGSGSGTVALRGIRIEPIPLLSDWLTRRSPCSRA